MCPVKWIQDAGGELWLSEFMPNHFFKRSTARFPFFVVFAGLLSLASLPTLNALTLEALINAARERSGGSGWDKTLIIVQTGQIDDAGMKGDWRAEENVVTGEIHCAEDFGRLKREEVWGRQAHWRRDFSGGVHRLDSSFARQASATDAWLARRDYLRPSSGSVHWSDVEERELDGRRYHATTATPKGGQPIELWFDAETKLLARTVRQMPIHIEATTFEDYRDVSGLKLPYRIIQVRGAPSDRQVIQLSEITLSTAAAVGAFEKLETRRDWRMPGSEVTVPIEFEGFIGVEATIDGKGPYSFILDTGGHNILTPDAARALGLENFGAGISGGAGPGNVTVKYAKVAQLKIGELVLEDQPFSVIPMSWASVERGRRAPYAGILGLELFERFATRIDYRNQTLTFTPLNNYRRRGAGRAVPITFSDDMPLVAAKLNGVVGDFAIDTGNAGTLVIQHRWAKKQGMAETMKRGIATVSYGQGGESRNWASRADTFELSGNVINRPIIRYAEDAAGAFSSHTEAGNLGNSILPYFVVEFDYERGQMWMEDQPGFEPPPFSTAGLGLFKIDAHTCQVVTVTENGAAALAGVTIGDQVTEVDGRPIDELSYVELKQIFTRPEGTRVPVGLVRAGKKQTVTLVLKVLLP